MYPVWKCEWKCPFLSAVVLSWCFESSYLSLLSLTHYIVIFRNCWMCETSLVVFWVLSLMLLERTKQSNRRTVWISCIIERWQSVSLGRHLDLTEEHVSLSFLWLVMWSGVRHSSNVWNSAGTKEAGFIPFSLTWEMFSFQNARNFMSSWRVFRWCSIKPCCVISLHQA